jgi:hypothetical protein
MNLPTKIPSSLTTHMTFGINVMHGAWCLHPLRTYTSNDRGSGLASHLVWANQTVN